MRSIVFLAIFGIGVIVVGIVVLCGLLAWWVASRFGGGWAFALIMVLLVGVLAFIGSMTDE